MLFKYGTTTPAETIFAQMQETVWRTWQWAMDQIGAASDTIWKKTGAAEEEIRGEL